MLWKEILNVCLCEVIISKPVLLNQNIYTAELKLWGYEWSMNHAKVNRAMHLPLIHLITRYVT